MPNVKLHVFPFWAVHLLYELRNLVGLHA